VLVRLARRSNTLVEEASADLRALEAIMDRVGVRPSRLKSGSVVVAERLGRLKLNGHVVTRSPLSTLIELDYLSLGAHLKRQLWENLRPHADVDPLIARADDQLERLAALRADARGVLAPS